MKALYRRLLELAADLRDKGEHIAAGYVTIAAGKIKDRLPASERAEAGEA